MNAQEGFIRYIFRMFEEERGEGHSFSFTFYVFLPKIVQ